MAKVDDKLREELKAELKAEVEAELKAEVEAEKAKMQERVKEVERQYTDKYFQEEEESFLEKLKKEPKVKIFIPIDPNNPEEVQVVSINGVVYSIPRGIEKEVPKPIYDIWFESYTKTMAINHRIKVSELGKEQDIKIS